MDALMAQLGSVVESGRIKRELHQVLEIWLWKLQRSDASAIEQVAVVREQLAHTARPDNKGEGSP